MTTSGNGMNLAPVGTSMHGLLVTGGNGGTSDGIKATAGTGGVDIRGNITGNLVGTVSTLTTYTGNTLQTGDSFARIGALGAGLTAVPPLVWDVVLASHLTAGSTGAGLNAASSAGDPWTTALPGAYSAGQAGFILGTNLNATISSRLAPTTAGRTLDVATTGEAGIDFGNILGTLGAANIAADAIGSSQLAASAASEIASAAWDVVLASHLTAGTTGAALNAAGSAGDPWITPLPGAYAAGQAGFILGTNLNATMTSRLASDVQLVRRATAQAGAVQTITLDSGASAVNGYYSRYGMGVLIASGTGIGQYRLIIGYNGTSKIATVNVPWLTNPDNTSVFVIIPR